MKARLLALVSFAATAGALHAQNPLDALLSPYENLLGAYLTYDLPDIPYGAALGLVDSVRERGSGLQGECYDTDYAVRHVDSATVLEVVQGCRVYQHETYTIPTVPPSDGADGFTYSNRIPEAGVDYRGTGSRYLSGGRIDSLIQRFVFADAEPLGTETQTFVYDAGRRTHVVGLTEEGETTGAKDSTITFYDAAGRFDSLAAYEVDEGAAPDERVLLIRTEGVIRVSDAQSRYRYTNEIRGGTQLYTVSASASFDSLRVAPPDSPGVTLARMYRTDDGRDSLYRSYLRTEADGTMVTTQWFYRARTPTAVPELPVVPGELTFANPLAPGASLRVGEGWPAGATLAVVGYGGRRIAELPRPVGISLAWPDTPPGAYLLVARAPGYAPRAWTVVVE